MAFTSRALCWVGTEGSFKTNICNEDLTLMQQYLPKFCLPCSWGYVHPRLLGLPELCHHLAEGWVTGTNFLSNLFVFKRQNPGKVRMCSSEMTWLVWSLC